MRCSSRTAHVAASASGCWKWARFSRIAFSKKSTDRSRVGWPTVALAAATGTTLSTLSFLEMRSSAFSCITCRELLKLLPVWLELAMLSGSASRA